MTRALPSHCCGRFIVFEPGSGDIDLEAARKHYNGGAELLVRLHAATRLLTNMPAKVMPSPLDNDIDVEVLNAQEQVTYDTTHEVDRKSSLISNFPDKPEGRGYFRRDPFFDQAFHVPDGAERRVLRFGDIGKRSS